MLLPIPVPVPRLLPFGPISSAVSTGATVAGLGLGLAVGGALALAAHAALEMERKR